MAETVEVPRLEIDIDLQRAARALAQLPDMTEKEARAMVRSLDKSLTAATKESQKAAKKMADTMSREHRRAAREMEASFREQTSAIKGLSGAAFGGIAGDAWDMADAFTGVSGSLALVGGALAAIAIAPEAIRSIYEFAAGAEETAEALGRVMTPEETARAEAFTAATDAAQGSMLELKLDAQLAVADGLRPMVELLDDSVALLDALADSSGVTYIGELSAAIRGAKKAAEEAFPPLKLFTNTPWLIADAIKGMRDVFASDPEADFKPMSLAALDAAEDIETASGKIGDAFGDTVEKAFNDAADAAKRWRTEAAKMEAEAVADIESGAAAERELENAILAASKAMQDQGQIFAMSPTESELWEINAAAAEASRSIASMGDPEGGGGLPPIPQWAKDAVAGLMEVAGAVQGMAGDLEQLASMEQRRHQERASNLKNERKDNRRTVRDMVREYEAGRESMTAAEQQAAEAEIAMATQSMKATNANIRAIEKEEERAAMKSYKRVKALQIAAATIDAARNA
ncbi:MAG: hypothetical protein ACI9K2_007601, partial [Myxococcota bacterium]